MAGDTAKSTKTPNFSDVFYIYLTWIYVSLFVKREI